MKKCPACAEQIQDEAKKCRFCGENLTGAVNAAPVTKAQDISTGRVIGGLITALGILMVLWSFGMDVSVAVVEGGQRVNNIGLMHRQQMLLIAGIGCGIFGLLLVLLSPTGTAGASKVSANWTPEPQAPVVQTGSPAVLEPVQVTDIESTITVAEMPQAGLPPKAAQVPQQASVVQPGGGSPAMLEPVQVTDKGGLGKNAGDSPSSLQFQPTPKAAALIGLLVVLLFLMMSNFGGSDSPTATPAPQKDSFDDGFNTGKGVGYSVASKASNKMTTLQMIQLSQRLYDSNVAAHGATYADGFKEGVMEGLESGGKGKN